MNLVFYPAWGFYYPAWGLYYPPWGVEPRLIDGFILLLVSRFGIKRSSFLTPV
jgi:hypothetical protein